MTRSLRADVRNPLIKLPAAQRIKTLPPESRAALDALLSELRNDCRANADKCWKKHKAPMAAYWKAASVYIGHLRKLTRTAPDPRANEVAAELRLIADGRDPGRGNSPTFVPVLIEAAQMLEGMFK